jgi:AcrR family transcriptional regulator
MARAGDGSGIAVGAEQGLVDLQPLFQKLKPGPGLPAEEVFADQRRRLHGAMIALVDRDEWGGVRVRPLARAAGVSTSTFYKHFVNAEDCLASTYESVMEAATQRAAASQRRGSDWRRSLRATIVSLIEDLAVEPRATRLALVDVFAAGPAARKRIGRAIADLEELLIASFANAPRTVTPPRHLVAGMAAGILRVARTTTLTNKANELPGIADELVEWTLSLPHPEVISLLRRSDGASGCRREAHPFPAVPERRGDGAFGERERLLRAAARLAGADGFASLTAPKVRSEAGVSRRRFDANFDDLEACFLDAVETVINESIDEAITWSANDEDWAIRTCRLVLAVCAQAARDRRSARLAFLEIFAPGRRGLLRREDLVTRAAVALQATTPAAHRPSRLVTEASIAAAWHIAHADIVAGRARHLPRVAPLLSYVILTPVVGPELAAAAVWNASLVVGGWA